MEDDRTDALTELYNLKMGDNEDISLYSRRASKSIYRMQTTGIRPEQIPNQEQQAFVYIRGLNNRVPMYAEYKNYLSNALETMKKDFYPKMLTEAINNASRFRSGTKSDHTPVAPVHTIFVADEVRTPKVSFTPPPKPAPSPPGKCPPEFVTTTSVRLQNSWISPTSAHIPGEGQLLRRDRAQGGKVHSEAGIK